MAEIDTSGVERPGAFLGRITSAVREAAARRAPRPHTGTLLDVGCGNGLFFASLGRMEGRLVGVDLDRALLSEARGIFRANDIRGAHLVASHAGALPFADRSVDTVLLLNTLINVPTDGDAEGLLTELMRVCGPSGQIVFDIRNASNPLLRARYWHHNRSSDFVTRTYRRRQIVGLFESRGFTQVHCDPIGPRLPFGAMAYLLVMRRDPG
jgi:ubiquinone/menaquinone biosynthesis C-methylase UbiE